MEEKMIPKFIIGDKIRTKQGNICKVIAIFSNCYQVITEQGNTCFIWFNEELNFELLS